MRAPNRINAAIKKIPSVRNASPTARNCSVATVRDDGVGCNDVDVIVCQSFGLRSASVASISERRATSRTVPPEPVSI